MIKTFFSQIKDVVSVLKFDRERTFAVAQRESATVWGSVFLVVPSFVALVLAAVRHPSSFGVIFSKFLFWPIFIPVLSFVGCILFMEFVAGRLFGGKIDRIGFFRVLSYSSFVFILGIIPFLMSFFVDIGSLGLFNLLSLATLAWMMVVAYRFLIFHYKLKLHDTVAVVVAGVFAYFLVRSLLGLLLVGKAYRFFY